MSYACSACIGGLKGVPAHMWSPSHPMHRAPVFKHDTAAMLGPLHATDIIIHPRCLETMHSQCNEGERARVFAPCVNRQQARWAVLYPRNRAATLQTTKAAVETGAAYHLVRAHECSKHTHCRGARTAPRQTTPLRSIKPHPYLPIAAQVAESRQHRAQPPGRIA